MQTDIEPNQRQFNDSAKPDSPEQFPKWFQMALVILLLTGGFAVMIIATVHGSSELASIVAIVTSLCGAIAGKVLGFEWPTGNQ